MQPITVSLPVRSLEVARAFFAGLGFTFSPEDSDADSACLVIGANARIQLLAEERFRDCVNGDLSHARSAGSVLIRLPARSQREVDEIVMRAIVGGGKPWPIVEEPPAYSASFQDPDGHLWQVICPSEMSGQEPATAAGRVTV